MLTLEISAAQTLIQVLGSSSIDVMKQHTIYVMQIIMFIVINKLLDMNVATFIVYNIPNFNTDTIMVWFINSYITIYCNVMKYSTGETARIHASINEINFNQSKKMFNQCNTSLLYSIL